jgi:GTP cyclohydrolase I
MSKEQLQSDILDDKLLTAFRSLLIGIGEDPKRGGLVETPARMVNAWKHWTRGYKEDPIAILKAFEDGGEHYDELVHVGHIPFYSQCEHHLAPFFGEVFFGYIPDKRIVGLSKMNRLVDAFARRLQVQERMTSQILSTFCDVIKPLGAGIVVRARHMCMESRGVCHQGCMTTTSAFNGVIKDQPAARAEFFSLTNAPKI